MTIEQMLLKGHEGQHSSLFFVTNKQNIMGILIKTSRNVELLKATDVIATIDSNTPPYQLDAIAIISVSFPTALKVDIEFAHYVNDLKIVFTQRFNVGDRLTVLVPA
jgi:hypothetical protein